MPYKDPKKRAECNKRWRQRNPDKVKKMKQIYNQLNKEKVLEYRREWRKNNREKINKNLREWRKNSPRCNRREEGLKYCYNLTLEQYNNLLQSQNNKCGICNINLSKPCVDHDHLTGKVRGILCNSCNGGLGLLGDTLERVTNAVKYLTKS